MTARTADKQPLQTGNFFEIRRSGNVHRASSHGRNHHRLILYWEDAMNDKERYRTMINARIDRFNETLGEIRAKAKARENLQPDVSIESIAARKDAATAKLKELDEAEENSWQKFRADLEKLIDDIDADLRKAMAYFG
jgi:hypothetical protein